ncbi:hypothetical protein COOONC_17905 [Cooperia oncophora]
MAAQSFEEPNSPLQGFQERDGAVLVDEEPHVSVEQLNTLSGAPEAPPAHEAQLPRPHKRVNLDGACFHGIVEASQRGTHNVIRYPIPGGSLCYTFQHLRTTTKGTVVYRCTGCKKNGRTTSIAVRNDSDLVGDPVQLPHVCIPWKNAQERVNRMVYKVMGDKLGKCRRIYNLM